MESNAEIECMNKIALSFMLLLYNSTCQFHLLFQAVLLGTTRVNGVAAHTDGM